LESFIKEEGQEEQYELFKESERMKHTNQQLNWEIFVELAVRRFAAWWENIEAIYKDA
jgi:hypothetical protein